MIDPWYRYLLSETSGRPQVIYNHPGCSRQSRVGHKTQISAWAIRHSKLLLQI